MTITASIPKSINFVPSPKSNKEFRDYVFRWDEIYRFLGADLQAIFKDFVRRDGTLTLTGNWAVGGFNITGIGNLEAATAKFGTDTDYSEFEADGTLVFNGDARTWRDELNELIGSRLESPASRIVQNTAEGSVTFESGADLTDYVVMNVQLNHDWDTGTSYDPHIHWWQEQSDIPNWLIQYRYQTNGGLKTTAWTYSPWQDAIFNYASGTLNQIVDFGPLTPPVGAGLSDILQIRLLRDNANDSGEFAGADPVAGDVDAVNLDVHIEINTTGSRTEYSK